MGVENICSMFGPEGCTTMVCGSFPIVLVSRASTTRIRLSRLIFLYIFLRFGGTKPLFISFLHYLLYIHTNSFITFAEFRSSFFNAESSGTVEGLHWGAAPRFELGAALQQPDTLLSEPCRTHLFFLAFSQIVWLFLLSIRYEFHHLWSDSRLFAGSRVFSAGSGGGGGGGGGDCFTIRKWWLFPWFLSKRD